MDANTKLVQDCYAAFGRGDVPFILAQCADTVDWQGSDAPEIPYHGRYRGKDGALQFFQRIGGALDVKAFEPKTFLSSGDEVFATGSWTCTARGTGKVFTAAWAMRFVVKNGKLTFFRSYEDTAITAAALRK
jgi:ketosteroid isomerase-like protein